MQDDKNPYVIIQVLEAELKRQEDQLVRIRIETLEEAANVAEHHDECKECGHPCFDADARWIAEKIRALKGKLHG